MKEYEPEIAKVVRQNHRGIQRVKANELVPGDVVEVSGRTCFFIEVYSRHKIVIKHRCSGVF